MRCRGAGAGGRRAPKMPAGATLLLLSTASGFQFPPQRHAAPRCGVEAPAPTAAARFQGSSPAFFRTIESSLEALTGDPQLLLESVVGLGKQGSTATYDREGIVNYFQVRPTLMVSRTVEFLAAFQRIRTAWDAPSAEGAPERGAVLRAELASLGPVAVKVGQTLSQRPDILPEDVCEALKGLQTTNAPFPDEEAHRVIAEEFGAKGPLAPGLLVPGYDEGGPPLFAALGSTCIASASLGQVYRGEMHDGREVAVKVQRPGALRQCLLDGSVIITALKLIQGKVWEGDLLGIFDTVAAGVVQELDFRNEAANAREFKRSLLFLGYVDVPDAIPELTQRRAMAMDWVYGRHLSALSPEEAMRMTYMSCEAVTAGLVLTGLVHADPHEGNIMLADDGRLVFLDFGLVSRVEEPIMEAFASGIQCVLAKDYLNLVKAFVATGFVGDPIEWRAKEADPWQRTHPDGEPVEVMAAELMRRMEACPGGGSRFGALSTVLGDMGFNWLMYTPPYVILLIRTFLTLEGIAGQVDPKFNIYEVALPWAVKRALSPSTAAGAATLRDSILTAGNQFQWARVEELIEQQREDEREAREAAGTAEAAEGAEGGEAQSARGRMMSSLASSESPLLDPALAAVAAAQQAQQAATPLDSLVVVLGSSSGATLRRIARDLDSTGMLLKLASPDALPCTFPVPSLYLPCTFHRHAAEAGLSRRAAGAAPRGAETLRRALRGRARAGPQAVTPPRPRHAGRRQQRPVRRRVLRSVAGRRRGAVALERRGRAAHGADLEARLSRLVAAPAQPRRPTGGGRLARRGGGRKPELPSGPRRARRARAHCRPRRRRGASRGAATARGGGRGGGRRRRGRVARA